MIITFISTLQDVVCGVVLVKQGLNIIERPSKNSSMTIPSERLFQYADVASQDSVSFSGCGWPEHMLIPKGSVAGFPCQLFVMVSDHTSDQVGILSCSESFCVYLLLFFVSTHKAFTLRWLNALRRNGPNHSNKSLCRLRTSNPSHFGCEKEAISLICCIFS